MEFFKFLLFGVSGVSVIFWVCVIAMWHTYMFPRFFAEDRQAGVKAIASIPNNSKQENRSLIKKGSLRPLIKDSSLKDRSKYSRTSFVVADFSALEEDYTTNRLYQLILLSLGIFSFLILSYGLRSGLTFAGIQI